VNEVSDEELWLHRKIKRTREEIESEWLTHREWVRARATLRCYLEQARELRIQRESRAPL
jgi:hypothetical protein